LSCVVEHTELPKSNTTVLCLCCNSNTSISNEMCVELLTGACNTK
jgi:hypothetical protein